MGTIKVCSLVQTGVTGKTSTTEKTMSQMSISFGLSLHFRVEQELLKVGVVMMSYPEKSDWTFGVMRKQHFVLITLY